jgi:hypothetical protein
MGTINEISRETPAIAKRLPCERSKLIFNQIAKTPPKQMVDGVGLGSCCLYLSNGIGTIATTAECDSMGAPNGAKSQQPRRKTHSFFTPFVFE